MGTNRAGDVCDDPERGVVIAAHLIVGEREEPFLSALLESLDGPVEWLLVNDNSSEPSPHAAILDASAFARRKRLAVDRTPWRDFSTARNRCIALHREVDAGPWALFVDADEVHGDALQRIAANLHALSDGIDFVDGYMWEFFQSLHWYTSIDRCKMLFRMRPDVRWTGTVHEQLEGLGGARTVLPYVFGHYSAVLPARRHAEKGRQYSGMGQEGEIVPEHLLDAIDVEWYFRDYWAEALRFRGKHPRAIETIRPVLERRYAATFAQTDQLVRKHQSPLRRARNVLRALNFEQRWRLRNRHAVARGLMR